MDFCALRFEVKKNIYLIHLAKVGGLSLAIAAPPGRALLIIDSRHEHTKITTL